MSEHTRVLVYTVASVALALGMYWWYLEALDWRNRRMGNAPTVSEVRGVRLRGVAYILAGIIAGMLIATVLS